MDDGTRDGYREGDILFVDPEATPVADKDVIAILPSGKMLFRRLKEDGEGSYLLALNGRRIERWEEGTIIRGVVIFSGNFR
jgi:SOS-response transcriptional repressor LexA